MNCIDEYPKAIEEKILNRISGIELVVSEKCQNNCKYCYRVKKHNASPITYITPSKARLLLNNFLETFKIDVGFYSSRCGELFGGDAGVNYQYLKEIIHIMISEFKFRNVVIPTNARLLQELAQPDLIDLLEAGENRVSFSLSVDGSPQDAQRSLSKFGKMLSYDEKINYQKLVAMAKKYHFGFHPMLTFESISTWLDTVKSFFDMGIVPYLLEVRHPLMKDNAIDAVKTLGKIRQFLEPRIDKQTLRQSNTLSMSIVPRGLGCSALTTISIMPNGDLPFCHRVVDPPWVKGNVLEKTINFSKMISETSIYNHRNHPLCMACVIRDLCAGQCAGASYEYWGDPWIPIESICNFQRLKTYIFAEIFDDWKNIYDSHNQHSIEKDTLKNTVENTYGADTINKLLSELQ